LITSVKLHNIQLAAGFRGEGVFDVKVNLAGGRRA
jgi:hypothetical protein